MINERIKFRIFKMPCCGQLLCWVNPRLPNYCPECGNKVFLSLKTQPQLTMYRDDDAWLKYKGEV